MKFFQRFFVPFALLLVFALTVIPYLESSSFGLVDFDDYAYVGRNSFVTTGLSWSAFCHSFTYLDQAIWMPLTWMSYMLDFSFFKGSPGAMHVHSFLLHAIDACLLFILLLQILRCFDEDKKSFYSASGKSIFVALLATLAWSLHPLRVESVTWVAARKDVLSLLWELVAMICWVEFRKRRSWTLYGLSLFAFVLGSFAKPSVMTFPFLMLLLDWLLFRCVEPRTILDIFAKDTEGKRAQYALVSFAPYVLPIAYSIFLGIFAAYAQSVGQAMTNMSGVPLWWKVLNALVSYGIYIWHTFIPFNLSPECVARWPEMPRFVIPGCMVTALLLWWIIPRLKTSLTSARTSGVPAPPAFVMAGILWFSFALVPFLGIAGFGYHAFADRFTYIPSIGLSLVLCGFLLKINPRYMVLPVLPVIALLPLTHRQSGYWFNDETIYKRTLQVDGDKNAEAHMGLGMYYFEFRHENLELALDSFKRAYESNPEGAGKIGPLYIMALCEANRIDEATVILRWYSDWKDRHLSNVPENAFGGPSWGQKPHYLFRTAKVVWYASQKNLIDTALSELRDLEQTMGDNINFLYAKGLVQWKRGEKDSAREIWKKMRESGKGEDYILYRFTKDF